MPTQSCQRAHERDGEGEAGVSADLGQHAAADHFSASSAQPAASPEALLLAAAFPDRSPALIAWAVTAAKGKA